MRKLLTPSALGDERTALGLPGVSLKAGAESAIATLWCVDDEAASELIGAFYGRLETFVIMGNWL